MKVNNPNTIYKLNKFLKDYSKNIIIKSRRRGITYNHQEILKHLEAAGLTVKVISNEGK